MLVRYKIVLVDFALHEVAVGVIAFPNGISTGSPSSFGTVNMTLRKSVIIRETSDLPVLLFVNMISCGVCRGFRAISVGFSFSVLEKGAWATCGVS